MSAAMVALAAGCVSPPQGGGTPNPLPEDQEAGHQAGTGVADRGERGGPTGNNEGAPPVGLVKTQATDSDTIELFTADAAQTADTGDGGGGVAPDWAARLSITFASATRDGDALTFTGTATYLHDQGEYLLHSQDFTVEAPSGGQESGGSGTYASSADEPLAELTQDEPQADFEVTIDGVPAEAPEDRDAEGLTGRYIRYETPEELWGHAVSPPNDFVPGRLCYAEGDEWHQVPVFEYPDIPCG